MALYDLSSGKLTDIEVSSIQGKLKGDNFHFIAISHNASAVFISDDVGRLYRSLDGKPFVPFPLAGIANGARRFVSTLAVSPDGKKLAIGEQGLIRIVEAASGEPVWLIFLSNNGYRCLRSLLFPAW